MYRWDLSSGVLEAGSALHGTIYPRRCDLSPDGDVLAYLAFKRTSPRFMGGGYVHSAVSRLPWLYALAAWRESGTWTRGCHFVAASSDDSLRVSDMGTPDHGDDSPLRGRYRLVTTAPLQYAVERRRGWIEHEDCPARQATDVWDEQRSVILMKSRPHATGRLVLRDRGYHNDAGLEGRRPAYVLETKRRQVELADVSWADWDNAGRLLVATTRGQLQVRDADHPELRVVEEHCVDQVPARSRPAPDWAQKWSSPRPPK